MPSCPNVRLQHLCDGASLLNLFSWWFEATIAVKDIHGSVGHAACKKDGPSLAAESPEFV